MSSLFSLEGKVALVTGASSGLGRQFALALAREGAKVAIVARRVEKLEGVKAEVEALGAECFAARCDVMDKESIKEAVAAVKEKFGRIDILVNNAGVGTGSPAESMPDEVWEKTIDTNLNGVYYVAREVGKVMIEQNYGKIINIASMLSYFGGYTVPAYAASKGGVAQLTKALANEWASKNININALAPGYMDTPMNVNLVNDPVRNTEILSRIPAKRWGTPDDMKGSIIFLASKASDYLNGAVIPVDGGYLAK